MAPGVAPGQLHTFAACPTHMSRWALQGVSIKRETEEEKEVGEEEEEEEEREEGWEKKTLSLGGNGGEGVESRSVWEVEEESMIRLNCMKFSKNKNTI